MNKPENDNQSLIEDLPVTDEQANQTKAGAPGSRADEFDDIIAGSGFGAQPHVK